MATASSIKEMFPEFASLSDDIVNIYISNSQTLVNKCLYGSLYELALSYSTAHLLKIMKDRGRELSSETVDKLSRSYKTTNNDNDFYSSTSYGKMFNSLRKRALTVMRPVYGI